MRLSQEEALNAKDAKDAKESIEHAFHRYPLCRAVAYRSPLRMRLSL